MTNRKPRGLIFLPLLGLALLSGCSTFNDVDRSPPWSDKQWRQMQNEDRERLVGRDQLRRDGLLGLKGGWRDISEGIGVAWNGMVGNTPAKNARKMHDIESPDRRREGIFHFADRSYGRRDPYLTRYRQIAEMDKDFTVRAAAVRVLNRSRDRESIPLYIKGLDDQSALVRLESAKALANMPDDRAVTPLLRRMRDEAENRDVRIAAADALRSFKNSEVAQALIGVLQDRDFGIAWQARQSLLLITGKDFQYDLAAWLQFIASGQSPVS